MKIYLLTAIKYEYTERYQGDMEHNDFINKYGV